MSRTINRAVARGLYEDFSKNWRKQARLAGKYGQPGIKKPAFSQWYAMHQKNEEMMRQSTPADVQEYMGEDPWEIPTHEPAVQSERGVMTMPMTGDGEDQ